jgi:hypothetical protein
MLTWTCGCACVRVACVHASVCMYCMPAQQISQFIFNFDNEYIYFVTPRLSHHDDETCTHTLLPHKSICEPSVSAGPEDIRYTNSAFSRHCHVTLQKFLGHGFLKFKCNGRLKIPLSSRPPSTPCVISRIHLTLTLAPACERERGDKGKGKGWLK